MISERPLSTNIFISIVQEIKQDTAGIRVIPGTVLKNPVTGEVVYTPPSGESVIRDKLKNLEDFLYSPQYAEIDPLIKNPTISRQTASKYLHQLCSPYKRKDNITAQILKIYRQGRENIFFNQAMFDILSKR